MTEFPALISVCGVVEVEMPGRINRHKITAVGKVTTIAFQFGQGGGLEIRIVFVPRPAFEQRRIHQLPRQGQFMLNRRQNAVFLPQRILGGELLAQLPGNAVNAPAKQRQRHRAGQHINPGQQQ